MSAPTITITAGVGTWSADPLPYQWHILPSFADGTSMNDPTIFLSGDVLTHDFTYTGGGVYLKMYGTDENDNIIYTPTLSGPCPNVVY